MAIQLSVGSARASILPEFGGRLHQLEIAGEPILSAPADVRDYAQRPTRGGSFPMAPWPNRIAGSRFSWGGTEYSVPDGGKPNAIHGRVLDEPWTVLAADSDFVELACPFDDGWPWSGSAWQRFELRGDSLSMRLEVRSDRDPFPAGCGWHPWFRRDAFGATGVRLGLVATRRYELDQQLPTGSLVPPVGEFDLSAGPTLGERRLDDCYSGIAGPAVIDWGRVQLTLAIKCPEPHVQVYTPPDAFCIEPQTCAPDAFNLAGRGVAGTGAAVARPGQPVAIESTWSWQFV